MPAEQKGINSAFTGLTCEISTCKELRVEYTKMINKMQLCRIVYCTLAALHVSSDIFAHHQEHLNCITAFGITHVCRSRLVSWECWNKLSYIVASCW